MRLSDERKPMNDCQVAPQGAVRNRNRSGSMQLQLQLVSKMMSACGRNQLHSNACSRGTGSQKQNKNKKQIKNIEQRSKHSNG